MRQRPIGLIVVVVLACAMRLPGLFTDFWLDEIWSHTIAMKMSSTPDILLSDAARLDNNHPLNTLLIRAIGDRQNWILYRIPSFLAGVGAVLLAVRIMSRRGPFEALAAAVLVGTSFPLVFYSSEARGYSLAVFFALLAFDALDRELTGARKAFMFNLACVLGFLSHLTFLHFYAGAAVWTLLHVLRSRDALARKTSTVLRLHAVPIATIVALHLMFIRHLTIGGAPPTRPLEILLSSLSLSVGGPEGGPVAWLVALAAAGAFIASQVWLLRQRSEMWVFYAVSVIVAPAFVILYDLLLSERVQPLMVSYFLVALIIMLMALSQAAGSLARRQPKFIATVMSLVVIGNLLSLSRFLSIGRGEYSLAVRYMIENTSSPQITVAGDSNFRVGTTLDFYRRILPTGRTIDYYDGATARGAPPTWLIKTSHASVDPPPPRVTHAAGAMYLLERTYPAGSLSGVDWYLYRIEPESHESAR